MDTPNTFKRESLRMALHNILEQHHPIDLLEMLALFAERKLESRRQREGKFDEGLNEFCSALEEPINAAGNLDWDDNDLLRGQFAYQAKSSHSR
jgi:hypothetical protein